MSNLGEQVLKAIEAHQEQNQESSFRRHLGASAIGGKCAREVWFGFRWAKRIYHEARMLRLFNRGHYEEPRFVSYLQAVGATVWTVDEYGKQFKIVDCGGHYGGSCDGVAMNIPGLPPGMPVLIECKTYNDKWFKKLLKEGLAKTNPKHIKQAMSYMRGLKLTGCLYMAVNKNDDALHLLYFAYDSKEGETIARRAQSIVFTDQAPARISDSPSWFECMFCDFKGVCHGSEMPHVNCRTCAHSTPLPDGTWHCRFGREEVTSKPEAGCPQHVFNPTFFPHASVTGQDLDRNAIFYQTRQGVQVINGPNDTPSTELDLR